MRTVQDQQDLQWIVKTFIQHSIAYYFYRFNKFRRRPAKSESPTCVNVTNRPWKRKSMTSFFDLFENHQQTFVATVLETVKWKCVNGPLT